MTINLKWEMTMKRYQEKKPVLAHRANGFHFFPKKQLTVTVNPRRVRSASCGIKDSKITDWQNRHLQHCFCECRPKNSGDAHTATKIRTSKLEENYVIVFQKKLDRFNRSKCIFEGSFEDLIYPTRTRPSETISLKWETIMNVYWDQKLPGISTIS